VVTCWAKEEVSKGVREVGFKDAFGKDYSMRKELNVPAGGVSFLFRLSWTNVHFYASFFRREVEENCAPGLLRSE